MVDIAFFNFDMIINIFGVDIVISISIKIMKIILRFFLINKKFNHELNLLIITNIKYKLFLKNIS